MLLLVVVIIASSMLSWLISLKKNQLRLQLSFSAAFLLAITFSTILPEVFEHDSNQLTAIVILGGFFLQIILEAFSHGIEHGHAHLHQSKNGLTYLMPLTLSLCIHSFLEGLPLHGDEAFENPIYWGIVLHNIPVSFTFGSLIQGMQIPRKTGIFLIFAFALSTPLGWLSSFFISQIGSIHDFHHLSLAVTVGIFLHISTTIIFEAGENHKYNLQKMLTILFGFALGLLPGLL
ncbi:MAG: ZIP family metal transporter [Candidatus Competibacteraceae bacterium]|nr:ZIP family metal transporter [Candidatus Competibacteraceae bacterium]